MIYLIDTIGIHTGAHYYDESFCKIFKNHGINVKTLSNFENYYSSKLFDNFYKNTNLLKKTAFFLRSYFAYIHFILSQWKKNFFVYQSFGLRIIDMLFVFPFALSDRFIVDIHDMYSFRKSVLLPKIQNIIYKHFIKTVIVHSAKTEADLLSLGFKGKIIYTPHLPYLFDKDYDLSIVSQKMTSSVEPSKINLLFFGSIRQSKGLDILIDALNGLDSKYASAINLIIAGDDKANILQQQKDKINNSFTCHIFNRRIDEMEVNYLFSKVDYAILPYRDIYQSGVLETAIYFKVPVIVSGLSLFQKLLDNYPSFGHVLSSTSSEGLKQILVEIIKNKDSMDYYKNEDLIKHSKSYNVDGFVERLHSHLSKIDKINGKS